MDKVTPEVQRTIGDLVIQGIALRMELDAARERIAELEALLSERRENRD